MRELDQPASGFKVYSVSNGTTIAPQLWDHAKIAQYAIPQEGKDWWQMTFGLDNFQTVSLNFDYKR